jgi:hypothetical protein
MELKNAISNGAFVAVDAIFCDLVNVSPFFIKGQVLSFSDS